MSDMDKDTDTGVIVTLLERMRTQRLPRALDIKEKVDRGEKLDEYDIDFLEQVFADASDLKPLWDRHPEVQEIAGRVVHLYHEITAKALQNEGGTPD
jgi:hypothetical protein